VADATAITGNQWRQLALAAQQNYVFGVIDAWNHLGEFNKPAYNPTADVADIFLEQVKCASNTGMTYAQIFAIVQKYMEISGSAPWHRWVWTAFTEMCGQMNK
jgi:hypothetical protein